MNLVLLIIMLALLVAVLPAWPHSTEWGFFPSGAIGTLLIVMLVLALLGRA